MPCLLLGANDGGEPTPSTGQKKQKHALLLPSQGVEHQPRGRGLSLLWSVFEDEKLERYESGCGVMENPATFIEHH